MHPLIAADFEETQLEVKWKEVAEQRMELLNYNDIQKCQAIYKKKHG